MISPSARGGKYDEHRLSALVVGNFPLESVKASREMP